MKRYNLNSILIFSTIFILSGCYTVLWMPDEQFPSEITSNEYYDETYYGDYYGFYDYPWWLTFAPPSVPIGSDYIRNESGTTSSVRNEGQGRGTENDKKILTTSPPSRDISNSNNSNKNNSSNNNNSSSTNSNNDSSRSSDNNSIRNNDGNRNTNSGRK